MDAEQIMSLLASADDPGGRLIPQLREVAAWMATLDEEVLAEVLDREPELLLRADSLTFTDEARARMVSSLLTEDTAMRVERYDRRVRRAFGGLVHPSLPDQIHEALRPEHSIPVRQMAFTLAQAAAMPELQQDLVVFAFNTDEPPFLRDDASGRSRTTPTTTRARHSCRWRPSASRTTRTTRSRARRWRPRSRPQSAPATC
jgi:hypothetical protein